VDPRDIVAISLRERRTAAGLSQAALGKVSGMHFTEISRLQRAQRDPRLGTIVKLARALNTTSSELLSGIDTPASYGQRMQPRTLSLQQPESPGRSRRDERLAGALEQFKLKPSSDSRDRSPQERTAQTPAQEYERGSPPTHAAANVTDSRDAGRLSGGMEFAGTLGGAAR